MEISRITKYLLDRGVRTEASTKGVLLKNVFLEVSQSSLENTCARASFLIKLQGSTLLKKVLTQVFCCEFCEISKNTFFTEHIWTTYSIRTDAKLREIHYRRSPLVQGRLEIPCTLIIQMPGTVKSN